MIIFVNLNQFLLVSLWLLNVLFQVKCYLYLFVIFLSLFQTFDVTLSFLYLIILIFFKLFTLKHSCSLFDLVCFQGFNREIQILNNHSVLAEFLSCPFHKCLFLLFITLLKYFFLFPNLINQHLSLFLKSLFL